MDSHDGQRHPDSALILEGIRALHERLNELEHRVVPGERRGPGSVPAWPGPSTSSGNVDVVFLPPVRPR